MPVVYETIRVKDARIPLLDRHVVRLEANCRATGLPLPECPAERVLAARDPDEPNVKLRVTWDGAKLEITSQGLPNVVPLHVITASVRHAGYRVKTTDREVFDRARTEAHAVGADEALLLTQDGYVAEGTLFAVGWFRGSGLCVPCLDLGILPSIGRSRVLEVASQLGIPCSEGRFMRKELDGRPVFATTATRGVVRIATLDGAVVPSDDRLDRLAASFWPD